MRSKLGPPCVPDVPQILDAKVRGKVTVEKPEGKGKVTGRSEARLFGRSPVNDVEPVHFRFQRHFSTTTTSDECRSCTPYRLRRSESNRGAEGYDAGIQRWLIRSVRLFALNRSIGEQLGNNVFRFNTIIICSFPWFFKFIIVHIIVTEFVW